jgi:hypothetical protein
MGWTVGWRDEQREQAERTLDALDGIRTDIRALRTVPVADRGYVSELQRFPALQIALRLCVDRSDPHDVRGLVELFKRVPDEHIDRSTGTVRCLCGAVTAFGDLHPCPGGCGRWFAADESGAFAARVQIVAEAA